MRDLDKTLKDIKKFNALPYEAILDFIKSSNIKTLDFVENLGRVEPLLQNIEKKEHFIHMFNVYLLGSLLWEGIFGNYSQYDNLWKITALSHDIAYPIEAIESELKEFFTIYFHEGKTPQTLISKELLFSYENFNRNLIALIDKAAEILDGPEDKKGILEDLVLYNLYSRSDHAVISALLTLLAYQETSENTLPFKSSISILLHNLYQWKYYAFCEISEFLKVFDGTRNNEIIKLKNGYSGSSMKKYKFLKDPPKFIKFLFERRFKSKLEGNNLNKSFRKNIQSYKDNLQKLKIKIDSGSDNSLKKLSFILSLSDFFQEWGRLSFKEKGLLSLGIRILEFENKKLRLICPLVGLGKNKYFSPNVENSLSDWKGYSQELLNEGIFSQSVEVCKKDFWEEARDEIRMHVDTYQDSKNITEIHKALIKNYILKLKEFVFKFTFKTKDLNIKGLYEFDKNTLQVKWLGISKNSTKYEEYSWPE